MSSSRIQAEWGRSLARSAALAGCLLSLLAVSAFPIAAQAASRGGAAGGAGGSTAGGSTAGTAGGAGSTGTGAGKGDGAGSSAGSAGGGGPGDGGGAGGRGGSDLWLTRQRQPPGMADRFGSGEDGPVFRRQPGWRPVWRRGPGPRLRPGDGPVLVEDPGSDPLSDQPRRRKLPPRLVRHIHPKGETLPVTAHMLPVRPPALPRVVAVAPRPHRLPVALSSRTVTAPARLENEVLFELRPRLPEGTLSAVLRQYGLEALREDRIRLLDTTLVRARLVAPRRTVDAVLADLRTDARVASAGPNGLFTLQGGPDAAGAAPVALPPATQPPAAQPPALQWSVARLKLDAVHRITRGKDVTVAVIDSGVDLRHPEFAGSTVAEIDFADGAPAPHAHGTAMVGAILAHQRLVGVAPDVHVLVLRAFTGEAATSGAAGTTDHIVRALDEAAARGAGVVNLSFAGPADAYVGRMLAALRQKGIAAVAAAGNAGPASPPLYPAADPNVIAVTAIDARDRLYGSANRGPFICVAAPGVDVLEPAPGSAYQMSTGTSVAAAQVAGIAALILARDPQVKPDELRRILTETASKAPLAPAEVGAGVVDPDHAIQSLATRPAVSQAAAGS